MFFIFLLFYYVYFFHAFNSGQKREKQQTTLGSLFTATGLLMRVGHASNWMKNQDGLGGLCGFISMRQASQWIVIPPFFPFYIYSVFFILRLLLCNSLLLLVLFCLYMRLPRELVGRCGFLKKLEWESAVFSYYFFLPSYKEFVGTRPARHAREIGCLVPIHWQIKKWCSLLFLFAIANPIKWEWPFDHYPVSSTVVRVLFFPFLTPGWLVFWV